MKVFECHAIAYCPRCDPLVLKLAREGYFPASPCTPTTAFAFTLLNQYLILDNCHKTPIQAFQEALVSGLVQRGHIFNQRQPFLQKLQLCIPWFAQLQRKIELKLQALMEQQEESTKVGSLVCIFEL